MILDDDELRQSLITYGTGGLVPGLGDYVQTKTAPLSALIEEDSKRKAAAQFGADMLGDLAVEAGIGKGMGFAMKGLGIAAGPAIRGFRKGSGKFSGDLEEDALLTQLAESMKKINPDKIKPKPIIDKPEDQLLKELAESMKKINPTGKKPKIDYAQNRKKFKVLKGGQSFTNKAVKDQFGIRTKYNVQRPPKKMSLLDREKWIQNNYNDLLKMEKELGINKFSKFLKPEIDKIKGSKKITHLGNVQDSIYDRKVRAAHMLEKRAGKPPDTFLLDKFNDQFFESDIISRGLRNAVAEQILGKDPSVEQRQDIKDTVGNIGTSINKIATDPVVRAIEILTGDNVYDYIDE